MGELIPVIKVNATEEAQLQVPLAVGVRRVSLYANAPLLRDPTFVSRVRENLQKHGLQPSGLDVSFHVGAEHFTAASEYVSVAKRAFEAAKVLGLNAVTLPHPLDLNTSRQLRNTATGTGVTSKDIKPGHPIQAWFEKLEEANRKGVFEVNGLTLYGLREALLSGSLAVKRADGTTERMRCGFPDTLKDPSRFSVDYIMPSRARARKVISALKRAAREAGYSGKISFEFVASSTLTGRQATLNDYLRDARKHGFGISLDLEHFAQHRLVVSLEQVHNPLKQELLDHSEKRVEISRRARGMLEKFYSSYGDYMEKDERKAFKLVLRKTNPHRDHLAALVKLTAPKKIHLPGVKGKYAVIAPSDFVLRVTTKAFANLAAKHASDLGLTHGHPGLLATAILRTRHGITTADVPVASEHSFPYLTDEGNYLVFGPTHEEPNLYNYLHRPPSEGSLYPEGAENILYDFAKAKKGEIEVAHEFPTYAVKEGKMVALPEHYLGHKAFVELLHRVNERLRREE